MIDEAHGYPHTIVKETRSTVEGSVRISPSFAKVLTHKLGETRASLW